MSSFAFILDISLQTKLKETYNYIKFLLSLQSKNLDADILISLNRDIIIHTTSILEGILTYLIIEIEKQGSEKEIKIIREFSIKKEYKPISLNDLILYKGEQKLYLSILKESKGKINGKLNIGNLIQLVKKLKIFESNIIESLEDIQKIRNDLHLQKILDNDIYENDLTDKKMLELFKFTKYFQEKVIEKLNILVNNYRNNFDLDLFILRLKEHGAKGSLIFSIKGSKINLLEKKLHIGPRTKISRLQIENENNLLVIKHTLETMGYKDYRIVIT